ncbi:SDR family oxidoreductase [Luteibacter yeojuensis]|uniref:SDR family oxidoreductase n=1 Tax=Luteibacter yeojuensis TaxID=345309 RepID=A0A7X5QT46_9GAMM|nr:SDR family oxidoreductase [Luteibacter yeojuensis]NID14932.1 SDR family oxidoreductase [Luteibacter yeojuensis]
MKILVIGGTGLIGSKVVQRLRDMHHEAIAASPQSGVNTITGEGLDAAMTGVDTVIDLANSPVFVGPDVLAFFETAGRNIFAAEKRAGVRYHVALSVVGADRLTDSDYMVAKLAQERLIAASGIAYTIVRSTQFFEFMGGIAQSAAQGGSITLPTAYIQPIASDDVAAAVVLAATGTPVNGMVEIGGPEKFRMSELVARFLKIIQDPHKVIGDAKAPYFGALLDDDALVAGPDAHLGKIDFPAWLKTSKYARYASAA